MANKKTDWKQLLKDSRRLEKKESLSVETLEKMKKESFNEASRLTKMLSESWFIHDPDVEKKKQKKRK